MARSEKRTPDADATQCCSKHGLSVPASLCIARAFMSSTAFEMQICQGKVERF